MQSQLFFEETEKLSVRGNVLQRILGYIDVVLRAVHTGQEISFTL